VHGRRAPRRAVARIPGHGQPVLGVRYCTVCAVVGKLSDRYEHGYLLWSDEPFTADVVTRAMTARGFHIEQVTRSANEDQPWAATISAGPPHPDLTYVGRFHRGDCAAIGWVGLWSRYHGYVVHDKPGTGWHAAYPDHVLYDQHDLYELAKTTPSSSPTYRPPGSPSSPGAGYPPNRTRRHHPRRTRQT
jgi:hypothetical protein